MLHSRSMVAAAGSVKAYALMQKVMELIFKFNIASGDKMKLDGSGNLEIDGTIKIAGGTPEQEGFNK